MIRLIYTLIIALASPLLLYGLYKKKEGKPAFGQRWKEHWGQTPKLKTSKQPIWIHAVSVGESIAATPVIKALKNKYPDTPILVTTTTSTGAEQISKLGDIVEHRYMPLDFPFAISAFLKVVKPSQLLIMETELWLNTLHAVARANIPITVLNARLSERSKNGYLKVQPVFRAISKNISSILCQSAEDKRRFKELGVPSEKLSITGSIKFDIQVPEHAISQGMELRNSLLNNSFIWIASSTHKGEDEIVLQAHKRIKQQYPDARLILVPRHPERFSDVFELCKQSDFNVLRRTDSNNNTDYSQCDVYLGDTMGEMLTLLQAADYCFMGGSLLGDKVGGHNLLEPAALEKPMLTGPSYYNFKEITETLIASDSVFVVNNESEIAQQLVQFYQNPELSSSAGKAAVKVVNNNKGAVEKTLDRIQN